MQHFPCTFSFFFPRGDPLVIASREATFNFLERANFEKSLEQMEPYLETNKRFIACAATTGRAELLALVFECLVRKVMMWTCEQLVIYCFNFLLSYSNFVPAVNRYIDTFRLTALLFIASLLPRCVVSVKLFT